ncbi:hypothetical protein KUV51_06815 [Tateyamaria omphalii]|uniref:hypothetical protein n=1 Tax=Tateyamaria omphalii TaxID=299262 RepID=UPI001C99CACE|nr:hypothetical protein [Tateyamaria omphalii]MBY5932704.1 hypothetical protein [Tateyamaria omphalii]
MADLLALAETEIRKRHVFFVDWYRGTADLSEMDVTAACFAPDFRIIWPSGGYLERAPLLTALAKAHNSTGPEFEIRIDIDHAVALSDDLCLMTFDEYQETANGPNARRGTAVFSRDDKAPNGVVWRHLQETWLTQE